MQVAGSKVAEENVLLRKMLKARGVADGEVEEYLRMNRKSVLSKGPKQVAGTKKRKTGRQGSSGARGPGVWNESAQQMEDKKAGEDIPLAEPGPLTSLRSETAVPSSSPPLPPPFYSAESSRSTHSDPVEPFLTTTPTSGQIMSCDVAAQIVANLRNDFDLDEARAAVGCVSGTSSCSVKNIKVLNILDEAL